MARCVNIGSVIVICICCVENSYCLCSFPTYLRGSWQGADRGNMTFENSTYLTSYKALSTDVLNATLDFFCVEQKGEMFLLKSTFERVAFIGAIVKFYMCLELHSLDVNRAFYYLMSEYDPYVQDYIYGFIPDTVNMSDACSHTPVPKNFISMVRIGVLEWNVTCPTPLQAVFSNVTVQHYSETIPYHCSGTAFDVCTDSTQINITYTGSCVNTRVAKTLSNGGQYRCIYSLTDGPETFLAVWNTDAGVSNPFSCFALKKIDNITYGTESPKYCSNTSSSTTAEPGGVKLVLSDITKQCAGNDFSTSNNTVTSESTSLSEFWGFSSLLVVLLFIILLCIWIYIKKRNSKQQQNDIFGSGTLHVDSVTKPTFDPSVIRQAKMYNFRPKKPIHIFTPIFDPNWIPRNTLRLKPAPKIAPLYTDVIDD